MASSTKSKKNNSGTRKREPYQRQASTVNAGARIAYGMLFLVLGACTAVSYFVQEGTFIVNIRKFMSGILGYGFWALAICFLWVAVIIFQGNGRSGLRIICILLIPVLFSAFIDLLSYQNPSDYSRIDMAAQPELLFLNGQNFKCGGVISGLLVIRLVQLLSRVGTGIIICIVLIVCVAMAISEPQAWYGSSGRKNTSAKNAKNGKNIRQKTNAKASVSGVGAALGALWNGESGSETREPLIRFDPASLIHMTDDNDGDVLHDLRFEENHLDTDVSRTEDNHLFSQQRNVSMVTPSTNADTAKAALSISSNSEQDLIPAAAKRRKKPLSEVSAGRESVSDVYRDSSYSSKMRPDRRNTKSPDIVPSDGRRSERNLDIRPRNERISGYNKKDQFPPVRFSDKEPERKDSARSSEYEVLKDSAIYNQKCKTTTSQGNTKDTPSAPFFEKVDNTPFQIPEEQSPPAKRMDIHPQSAQSAGQTSVRTRSAASVRSDIKEQKQVTSKEARSAARSIATQISKAVSDSTSDYEFPPSSLLRAAKTEGSDSEREIQDNKIRLENALHSFGVNSAVVKTTHGPTVTRYDIELEQGVKLTKVTNLSNDLALALGVSSVRIAPIPDEISTVGIEVPNKIVNTVSLKELIESDNFINASSRLSFAIGKDIGGNAIVGNISKLPHMLIAGTTGSGKSVCMNSLIISLLYKAKPDEVKFIMIDPKMVELGIYNSVPHLYVPVVTEPKKAAGALQWSVVEMLKRYRLFSEDGVRDLESYNTVCRNRGEQPLPQVVIVIDELADLMMAASKEVEESICRIAQMGRAAGMHLVIATQRPSADVITGLMKANIPSRIAFAVSSALESRIILDQAGADKLIGHGDMLYAPIGCGKPLRVQGAFVSDDEREKIIRFISAHSSVSPQTNEEINDFMNKAAEGKESSSGYPESGNGSGGRGGNSIAEGYDEMLPDAVEVVLEMKSCSVSMLQRRVKLGYSRAARIVDQMEELGIVGPYEGAKPRSVVVSREEWNEIKIKKLGLSGAPDGYALAAEYSSV